MRTVWHLRLHKQQPRICVQLPIGLHRHLLRHVDQRLYGKFLPERRHLLHCKCQQICVQLSVQLSGHQLWTAGQLLQPVELPQWRHMRFVSEHLQLPMQLRDGLPGIEVRIAHGPLSVKSLRQRLLLKANQRVRVHLHL